MFATSLLLLTRVSAQDTAAPFRPPAIPLFTTDPYMQTWLMGDNTTADTVRHWDQTPKEMVGLLHHAGTTYRVLGGCAPGPAPTPTTPGPADAHPASNLAPGKCDLANFAVNAQSAAGIAKCNEACYGDPSCQGFVLNDQESGDGTCWLKSCAGPIVPGKASEVFIITGTRPPPPPPPPYCAAEALEQFEVEVMPTYTLFRLRDAAKTFTLELAFLSTSFAGDYTRLSRPVYTVQSVFALTGANPVADANSTKPSLYLDFSAQHVTNEKPEPVGWADFTAGDVNGVKIGTTAQCVLCSKGDKTNINWGYLYLAPLGTGGSTWAGTAASAREAFAKTGALPTSPDAGNPRMTWSAATNDMPVVAAVTSLAYLEPTNIVVAYDDVASVRYYGTPFKGWWTTVWPTIEDAIVNATAPAELAYLAQITKTFNPALWDELAKVGGPMYAQIGALAYRQTLAATKLTINNQTGSIGEGKMWNFLKEISTNGDMQTMDVVYPASPMLLYVNPELLRLLLVPVLNFANNGTGTPFTNPFSPHQIGTYPIADATTQSQEPMPMENTGNMFLMLAGIIQRQPSAAWLKPFMPMLTSWADYLVGSLPFPANQLCTDDFTGRLANNTNLAAKGIVALEAFARICEATGGADCGRYSAAAVGFVATWTKEGLEQDPTPHYKIAYNFPNSYSIKYNIVWQKLLNYSAPFPWKEVVTETEVPYYISHANAYGPPMDSRHTYVKLDWLAWGATMADNDADFHKMIDPIFSQANDTTCRVPLTDLFDTVTATCAYGKRAFVARPVVGGVFAKMLAPNAYPHH